MAQHPPSGSRRAARQRERDQRAADRVLALMICTCQQWDRVTATASHAGCPRPRWRAAGVRLAPLDLLCELDGPGTLQRRCSRPTQDRAPGPYVLSPTIAGAGGSVWPAPIRSEVPGIGEARAALLLQQLDDSGVLLRLIEQGGSSAPTMTDLGRSDHQRLSWPGWRDVSRLALDRRGGRRSRPVGRRAIGGRSWSGSRKTRRCVRVGRRKRRGCWAVSSWGPGSR
jgi:hypothetical protein